MFGLGYGAMNFLGQLMTNIDNNKKAAVKEELGFSVVNKFEGSEKLNIPHIYDMVDVKSDHIICYYDELIDVYSISGERYFTCVKFVNLTDGMFLVSESQDYDQIGYRLYNKSTCVSNNRFRPRMSDKFNEFGYAILGIITDKSSFKHGVVNLKGEILLESEGIDNIYLYGVVASTGRDYVHIASGRILCSKGYDSMNTHDMIFTKTGDNTVYQINKNTGEIILHGVEKPMEVHGPKQKPQPKANFNVGTKPNEKVQGRNEMCQCGSGVKFKNCCAKNK